MPKKISISSDRKTSLDAASALSEALKTLEIPHAFLGFALNLHDSTRRTNDIDILVDITPNKVKAFLRPELSRLNTHFAKTDLNFYFAPELIGELRENEMMDANSDNVLIKILPVRMLRLPVKILPEMIEHQESKDFSRFSILRCVWSCNLYYRINDQC